MDWGLVFCLGFTSYVSARVEMMRVLSSLTIRIFSIPSEGYAWVDDIDLTEKETIVMSKSGPGMHHYQSINIQFSLLSKQAPRMDSHAS